MFKNRGRIKRVLEEYMILTVATLILVVGVYVFKFPNNFSFGGVTGIAVVLSAVLPATPGSLTFIINMLLLVFGFIFLGKGFGFKTVYVSLLMSVGLSAAESWFPMDGPLTNQPVLELMYAIVLPAFSAAIMFNVGASGGGTDIVAMILKKYTRLNIGAALFLVDMGIVIASCLVFDAQTGLCLGRLLFNSHPLAIKRITAQVTHLFGKRKLRQAPCQPPPRPCAYCTFRKAPFFI